MASSRRGLLLLGAADCASGPSELSPEPQNALRPPGRALSIAAGSPAHSAHGLSSDTLAPLEDSMPWEGRITAWWSLHQKQHLAQTLLVTRPAPPSSNKV
uniref:Uncharacterized protein n=1 Tax=Aotus nancymaae TaxID=37293 RepID=A0A2K5DDH3_AOTNA